jgi:DNA-binding NtrC family response regulator
MSAFAPPARGRPPAVIAPPPGLAIVVVEGRDAGRSVALSGGARVRVGSARDAGLSLHDDQVSAAHAELWACEGGVGVRDLGSATGTFVGALRVVEAVVPPATRVRLGRTVLSVGQPAAAADVRARLAQEGLVYESEAMAKVADEIRRLAPFAMSVLVEGETGTGKEVVARAVHALSMRNNGPFVIVDCGALPPSLLEAELFGHERGAFTSAEGQRAGAFELAHGGTLFLDEIGELPRESQASLLGVLSRRRFRRVGGTREVQVDVRVIAATNRDLAEEISASTFRSDLFYRLATARISLPPLRERPEDIAPLVEHFLREIHGDAASRPLTEDEARELRAHAWPGNVRELRAVVERSAATGALALDRPHRAAETPLPPATAAPSRAGEPPSAGPPRAASAGPLDSYRAARARAQAEFERQYLEQLISACGGNASEAARVARMDRPHLLRLLRRHHLR